MEVSRNAGNVVRRLLRANSRGRLALFFDSSRLRGDSSLDIVAITRKATRRELDSIPSGETQQSNLESPRKCGDFQSLYPDYLDRGNRGAVRGWNWRARYLARTRAQSKP
jgi:hypothetical protein